ncbi:MAG: ATP-binding protein, partial [Nitrospirota bacterium]
GTSMSHRDSNEKANPLLTHNFPARAKELCDTRSAVRNFLTHCGCVSTTVEDVVLAIDEACQNIIRHAYQGETDEEIILQIEREGNDLNISLEDKAPEVGSDCMKPRELEDIRPGGLGCHFIRQVMDEVSVGPSPSGRGNILRMRKRLE